MKRGMCIINRQKLDIHKCDTDYIVDWIKRVIHMRKKAKKEVLSNIRQYFEVVQN